MKLFDGKISRIFIGREEDLGTLQKKLDEIHEDNEAKKVYTVLNVPGIGKTELIKHFGKSLQNKTPFIYNSKQPLTKKALFFHITLKREDTRSKVYVEMVAGICKAFYSMFKDESDEFPTVYRNAIQNYAKTNSPKKFVEELTEGKYEKTAEDPSLFLGKITDEIPIILHFDEFQRSIPKKREEIDPDAQLYYQLSSFFSGILNNPILIILTGTKYTIISTIGDNLGSPLNGKVSPIVIPFLKEEEMEEFADRIILKTESAQEVKIKQMYLRWLKFMSGGHPRTMEYMSGQFITGFKDISSEELEDWVDANFDKKFQEINELTETELRKSHLRGAAIDKLIDLINQSPLSITTLVFEYINERMMKGAHLGPLEEDIGKEFIDDDDSFEKKAQLKEILSKFVEVGLFSRNGGNNFYISSIYAFNYFSEIFRKQVPILADAFRKLLSGPALLSFIKNNPSVLGFFWEPIFATILEHSTSASELQIPQSIVEIHGNLTFPKLDRKIDQIQLPKRPMLNPGYLKRLKPNLLYISSRSEGADGVLRYENTVFLMQIKCSKRARYLKDGLDSILASAKLVEDSEFTIIPWLIDVLGALKPKHLEGKNILYTTKKHLASFLPKQLY